jgi:hypothetical protein
MVSLKWVLLLLVAFIWIGFTAREFDGATQRRLFAVVVAIVLLIWAWDALIGTSGVPIPANQ